MPAAIVTGLLFPLVLIVGWSFIDLRTHNQWLLLLWAIAAFLVSVYSTVDRELMAQRRREGGFVASFIRPASAEAFRECYLPTWLRMGIWFGSSVLSTLILKSWSGL